MTTNPSAITCRNPKVVLIHQDAEDIAGTAKIIAEQTEHYRVILNGKNTIQTVSRCQAVVLLFALNTVEESVKLYTEIVKKRSIDYPHKAILLCSNKESGIAFHCCLKGLFDDYFVHRPLYEKFRLKMIIHNATQQSETDNQQLADQYSEMENLDKELNQLIDEGTDCRANMLQTIQNCHEKLASVANQYDNDIHAKSDTRSLIQDITQNHLQPLLHLLEQDIKHGLDSIIQQLVAQQTMQKNTNNKLAQGYIPPTPDFNGIDHLLSKVINHSAAHTETTEDSSQPPLTDPHHDHASKSPAKNSTRHILVVEDNPTYREIVTRVLTNAQMKVEEAENGLKALQKIKRHQYDLIIMDLFMPQLNGLQTTQIVRDLNKGKNIPIIALTGNKNKDLIKRWAAYDLKGYILKPSTKDEILHTVEHALTSTT